MGDFNAFAASRFNGGLESPLRARTRSSFVVDYSTIVEPNDGNLGSVGYRLFDGTVGAPYFTIKTPSGDVLDAMGFRSAFIPFGAPVSWSIVSGALPPGLSLVELTDDYADLQGTPTTVGDYEFTVQAFHDSTHVSQRACRIRVWPQVTVSNLAALNTFLGGIGESTDGIFLSVNSSDPDSPATPASYDSIGYDEGLAPVFQQVWWRATTNLGPIHLTIGPGSVPVAVNRIRASTFGPFTKDNVDEDPAGTYTLPFDPETIVLV